MILRIINESFSISFFFVYQQNPLNCLKINDHFIDTKKLKVFVPSPLLNFNLLNFYDNAISSYQNTSKSKWWLSTLYITRINKSPQISFTLIVFIYYNTFSFTNSIPGCTTYIKQDTQEFGNLSNPFVTIFNIFSADFLYPHKNSLN